MIAFTIVSMTIVIEMVLFGVYLNELEYEIYYNRHYSNEEVL